LFCVDVFVLCCNGFGDEEYVYVVYVVEFVIVVFVYVDDGELIWSGVVW